MTIDEKIGRALKLARLHRSRSQAWLGEEIGVTYQQIQKYENGTNRVTLEAFLSISKALEIKPGADVMAWVEKTARL